MYQKVKYIGPKREMTVKFPIPFDSRSAQEGEDKSFRKGVPVDLLPHQAAALCNQSPDVFKMVADDEDNQNPAR